MNFFTKNCLLIQIILLGLIAVCTSVPLKVSKPKALTPDNLTDGQTKKVIERNPTQTQPLEPNLDSLPYPPIQLYLTAPDPKGSPDFLYASNYPTQSARVTPTKVTLSLDPLQAPNHRYADESGATDEKWDNLKPTFSNNGQYDYYFPVKVVLEDRKYADKELQLMELQPPESTADVTNYYEAKPKKIPKKYQPNKKEVNVNPTADTVNDNKRIEPQSRIIPTEQFPPLPSSGDELVPIDNDGLVLPVGQSDIFVTAQPVERFAPKPVYRTLTEDDLNTGEYIPGRHTKEYRTEAINKGAEATVASISVGGVAVAASSKVETRSEPGDNRNIDSIYNDDNDRVEFQMHGFNGPQSYKFGFDTGKGENRQFRVEYRDKDGNVKGHYGWYDEKGKIHLTKYTSTAKDGFKSENVKKL